MFDRGDDSGTFEDVIDSVKSKFGRTQDKSCDFCGTSEGSMVVNRTEVHPDVESPPVVRCRDCFNDLSTYPEEDD